MVPNTKGVLTLVIDGNMYLVMNSIVLEKCSFGVTLTYVFFYVEFPDTTIIFLGMFILNFYVLEISIEASRTMLKHERRFFLLPFLFIIVYSCILLIIIPPFSALMKLNEDAHHS
jgi:hypothetical protein